VITLKNKIHNEFELRSINTSEFNVNESGEEKIIEGYAAIYDKRANIGGFFYEVIERGAFDSADLDDVLFSINHDLRKIPIARSRSNQDSTMTLKVDDKGLYIRAVADTENNLDAKALYGSIKRGDINGMSFIFNIEEERWTDLDKPMPTRYIKRFKKIKEVSAVTMPAYDGTNIQARDKDALDNAKKTLDNVRSQEFSNSNELEILKLRNKILAKGGR
jgi:HK97 family phage prohead protease